MDDRNTGIDLLKAISIVLIVLSHSIVFAELPTWLGILFVTIFLRLFFMVSGYLVLKPNLLSPLPMRPRIRKKFCLLIKPYIIFSSLAILWHAFICGILNNPYVSDNYSGFGIVFRDIFCALSGLGIGTLWFLPILFVTLVLTYLLEHVIQSKPLLVQAVILVIMFGIIILIDRCVVGTYINPDTLLRKIAEEYREGIHRILYGSAYSILGYGVHLAFLNIKKPKEHIFIILALAALTVISACLYNKEIMKVVFEITICMLIMWFALILAKFSNVKSKDGFVNKIITFLGSNTLEITIYHYIFLLPVEQWFFSGWTLFFINLLTTVVLVWALNRCEWHRKMFGH